MQRHRSFLTDTLKEEKTLNNEHTERLEKSLIGDDATGELIVSFLDNQALLERADITFYGDLAIAA